MIKNILLLTLLLFAGYSVLATGSEDFKADWQAADTKRQEASALGYEWKDTKKILKRARKAAEAGENEKAMELVAKALEQSEDAIAQQAREARLWINRVPQ